MGEAGSDRPMTREERLAAQLRANLRRRKAQARALDCAGEAAQGEATPALAKPDADG